MMRPLLISTTLSAMRDISRLWVTTSTALSPVACSISNSSICAPVLKSSSPVGSSASRTGFPGRQRPGDCDALLFAAGQFVRKVADSVAKSNGIQNGFGIGDAALARDVHSKFYVFERGEAREEVEALEYEAHGLTV